MNNCGKSRCAGLPLVLYFKISVVKKPRCEKTTCVYGLTLFPDRGKFECVYVWFRSVHGVFRLKRFLHYHTTSSFQKQPTQVPKPEVRNTLRKRRLDPTNILEPAKRISRNRAATNIASILAKGERKGNPAAAGLASGRARRVQQENDKPGKSPARSDSLFQITRHNPRVYHADMKCIEEYIGRIATFDMQKAFAIQVFCTAVSTWGQGVIDACNSVSAVTGYFACTIRKWVSSYFLTIGSTPESIENLDDELLKLELSSDRGSVSGNQSMIIHDEEFQRKARQFMRSNSCKKGQQT